jgi:hypothetical protein
VYLNSSELSVVFDSRLRVPISYATLPFLTMGQIAEESRITVFRRTHFCYWRVPSTRSEPWIQSLLDRRKAESLFAGMDWIAKLFGKGAAAAMRCEREEGAFSAKL